MGKPMAPEADAATPAWLQVSCVAGGAACAVFYPVPHTHNDCDGEPASGPLDIAGSTCHNIILIIIKW